MNTIAVSLTLCLCLVAANSQGLYPDRFYVPKPLGMPDNRADLSSESQDTYRPNRVYPLFKRGAVESSPDFQVKRMYVARIGKRQVYRTRIGK
ncbi:unnamed protein product [Bursaphelenchus okinawaensis]|uniref:Uncharacterized protein n=1 Tax=Bursaphelenchus okinawaensis TaxID=465554 RepID=A0A811KBU6_9BILA|nr:unnamed protein product [Bursaphelenchus okinawaensis]CAG9101193.1 unnamed protein product [Bursaphelenchus okinawaensis]